VLSCKQRENAQQERQQLVPAVRYSNTRSRRNMTPTLVLGLSSPQVHGQGTRLFIFLVCCCFCLVSYLLLQLC
jgi:hypothetical protein